MSADFFGQRRRALGKQAPPRSGLLLLFNKDDLGNSLNALEYTF